MRTLRTFAAVALAVAGGLWEGFLTVEAHAKDVPTLIVTPVTQDGDAAHNGVIYALPKTVVTVKVTAELTIEKVGPYYKYSNKYLNIQDVVLQDSRRWVVTGAKVGSKSVADPQQRYKISVGGGCPMPQISLINGGILERIGYSAAAREKRGRNADGFGRESKRTSDKGRRRKTHTMSYEDALVYEINFDGVRLNQATLTKTSTAAMAEGAAQMIYEIREKRLSLLGGEEATILHDAGSYERVMNELDRQEEELMSLFIGRRETVTVTQEYEFTPEVGGEASIVLLRFSEKAGFLDAMDLQGKPVYVDFEFERPKRLNEYADGSRQRKAQPNAGLRYIEPAKLTVKVIDRNRPLTQKRISVAQGGQTLTLPPDILISGGGVTLDTRDGSLKKIETNPTPNNK